MQLKKKFIKNGKEIEILFREPKLSDAKAAMEFINTFVDEKAYVSWEKHFTLKQEKQWLKKQAEKVKKKTCVQVFAFHNKKIIGSCAVEKNNTTTSHTGIIGIVIKKDHRSIGLGKFMMQLAIKEAKNQLRSEIIILHVYSKNKKAQNFYKRLGFRVAGKIPFGIKHYGKYMDNIITCKKLK